MSTARWAIEREALTQVCRRQLILVNTFYVVVRIRYVMVLDELQGYLYMTTNDLRHYSAVERDHDSRVSTVLRTVPCAVLRCVALRCVAGKRCERVFTQADCFTLSTKPLIDAEYSRVHVAYEKAKGHHF